MSNTEIGNRIKYVRDLRGATLDDIAKKVGVAKSTIQRYESGKINTIKIPVIESIAIALGVNPAWILGKSNEMELPSQKVPRIIQYYESLNNLGKKTATEQVRLLTLDEKYTKVTSIVKEPNADYLKPNAAHERTEVEIKEEERLDDENMLD